MGDDAAEVSVRFAFNAMGLYLFSPAGENYIVTGLIFEQEQMDVKGQTVTVKKLRTGNGDNSISQISSA